MVGLPRSWLASTYCRSCAFSAPVPSSTFLLWLRARLARPLRGDVVEASTVAVEHRLLASKLLPALHRNIDISRRDFNRVAHPAGHLSRDLNRGPPPAGHLSRDYRRARAAERLVDGLPGRRIILDRPAHALDRLLRACRARVPISNFCR